MLNSVSGHEESPIVEASAKCRPWQLLLLSAQTSIALEKVTKNLVEYFKENPHLDISDVAYTLQTRKETYNHRRMAVCQNLPYAIAALESLDPKQVLTSFQEPLNRDVVFMFSGQGSQYVNMGLELYRNESKFKELVDLCSEILRPHLSLDLRDILYPQKENAQWASEKLRQTFITQPALFAIEYALANLWMSWGVRPKALVGHSIGEYVAGCLAGIFCLDDALFLVAARARLMQGLPGGSMLSVFLSEKEIQQFLGENLSLAAINAPSICVVSGEKDAIADFKKTLASRNADYRHLETSHAFHSRMMEPILNSFLEHIKKVKLNSPQIPIVSNVTGKWITSDEAMDPDYWAKHLRQTVCFSDCVLELLKEPDRIFLEVGPGCTLGILLGYHPKRIKGQVVLASIPHPKERKSDVAFILNTVGRLWLAGVQMDWSAFYADGSRHRLPLPIYLS